LKGSFSYIKELISLFSVLGVYEFVGGSKMGVDEIIEGGELFGGSVNNKSVILLNCSSEA
jgi:hypothetical protein